MPDYANEARLKAAVFYIAAFMLSTAAVFGADGSQILACAIADACTSDRADALDALIPPICFFFAGWANERKWRAWL